MRRGSSGGSLDSGLHSGSTGSANSTDASFGSQTSQSALAQGLAYTLPATALTVPGKLTMTQGRGPRGTILRQHPVPEGTEV